MIVENRQNGTATHSAGSHQSARAHHMADGTHPVSMPRLRRDPHLSTGRATDAVFRGDRFRILYLRPASFTPSHELDVPERILASADGHYRPGELTDRQRAIDEAARYNRVHNHDFKRVATWAVVVEVGVPLRSERFSGCELVGDLGWEEDHLVYPLRVLRPNRDQVQPA